MRSPIKYSGVDKMKHKIFKTLLAVAVATITFCAEAETETVNGIKWIYSVKDGNASLESGCPTPAIPKSTSGAITIPSTLGRYPVTSIGEEAFSGCSFLTSVTIPNSVTNIGVRAFDDCDDRLYVQEMIPNVKLVDGWVVGYEEKLSGDLDLTGVRGIACKSFFECLSLKSVTIPKSVTTIGDDAFRGCGELTIYTDNGNADRLRKMLENAGANVKEIIEQMPSDQRSGGQKANEQEAEEQESRGICWWFVLGCVGVIVGLFFWIVRRRKKEKGFR
jgi:hypothetical protein